MEQFLHNLVTTWWGILIICIAAVAVLILLSTLLYRQFFKRFYDIFLSGLALLVLSPILLILIIVGAINMKGNPFFTQQRPGKNEKIFKLIKFRTMTNEKDENGNLLPDDVRLTKYGKFLRSTSLDELPELINIFIGNMSIVGPRPQLVRDMVFMTEEQRKRHTVSPGLTGLAQCSGRNNMSWEQKFEYDLKYIKKIGLWSDVGIIFMTVFKVFKRDGITEEGEATATDLGDYLLSKGEVTDEKYNELQAEAKELLVG
ncbi:MAG: sugar transferase [Clostridia bacterium]|nr:sugar transferase [Clostridia bacterium]